MSRKDDALAIDSVHAMLTNELNKLNGLMLAGNGVAVLQSTIDRQAKKVIESLDALKSVIKIVRR